MNERLTPPGPFHLRRFAPVLPPLAGDLEPTQHRVAIAGGGPVGLAVALGLARFGVRSVVIEADDSVCEGSRAICVSRRSLQILDRLGVADAFVAKGLPWTDGHSFYRGHEVLHFSMPQGEQQKFPPMLNLAQYDIEQFLLDRIERVNTEQPGAIDLRWASSVTALDRSTPDAVTIRIDTALGSYRTGADWLVACDGGQSFVRKSLDLDLVGTAYEGRYVIIDIELASRAPTERRAWFDPPWCRGSTVLMHRQPDDIWRIDYQLKPGDDTDAALAPERMRAFVQRHLDAIGEGHLPWKPVWKSVYRAGAMTLESYRHGRVLFAGNAAHVLPIFGVRGLNSGFEDADNLAWKLAFVVRGLAPDALLDSYSSERIQAFHINAENAMRSTEFMSPPSRGFDLMREAALSLARMHRRIAKLVNPRQTHAIDYRDSPLSSPSDTFASGPPPGSVVGDVRCADGSLLSDALATAGFTVLVFGAGSGLVARLEVEIASLGERKLPPVRIVRIDVDTAGAAAARALGAQRGSVYLVRPDGHVAGRWHAPDPEPVLRAIRRACARAGAREPAQDRQP